MCDTCVPGFGCRRQSHFQGPELASVPLSTQIRYFVFLWILFEFCKGGISVQKCTELNNTLELATVRGVTSRSLVMNDLSGAEGQFQICCGHICSLIRSLTAPLGDNTEVYMLARKALVIQFSNETFPASASASASAL